jgi:hypothetical protein
VEGQPSALKLSRRANPVLPWSPYRCIGYAVGLTTPPVVVSVTATTRIRLYGYRNGASTLSLGITSAAQAGLMADAQRLTAVKLTH